MKVVNTKQPLPKYKPVTYPCIMRLRREFKVSDDETIVLFVVPKSGIAISNGMISVGAYYEGWASEEQWEPWDGEVTLANS